MVVLACLRRLWSQGFTGHFQDVIIGIARSEGALVSPAVVHVDDVSIIDCVKGFVDEQAQMFASLLKLLGR